MNRINNIILHFAYVARSSLLYCYKPPQTEICISWLPSWSSWIKSNENKGKEIEELE